ncbi:glycine zipper 2TM domain-containing protein [Aquabacterium humicola]|uniref:glycine zipper 2TM domain-containing protein n=1 Tax=Aquabacterium humicola TaxID=3237377 RepID=UPI002542D7E7|nr:glycine zipper 2TM domain-containing protein [Rubrivivax pictus]
MNTMRRWPLAVLLASAAVFGTGCGSTRNVADAPVTTGGSYYTASTGTVAGIDVVAADQRGPGAGAVIGAIVGGVLGNQVGGGTGRAAATGIGAVGGAIIGHNIEKRRADDVYRVSVRFDNGERRHFDFQRIDDLRVGDRVRYEGGTLHRAYG